MKKLRVLSSLAALSIVLILTSCLGSDNDYKPQSLAYATVTGDRLTGFYLYADGGVILQPGSVPSPELLESYKRVYLAYTLQEGFQLPDTLKETSIIKIDVLDWVPIDTKNVIDLYSNEVAIDSLTQKNDSIYSFDHLGAYKGYVTLDTKVYWDQKNRPYMNLAFDSKKNISNDTVYFTLYYNSKIATNGYAYSSPSTNSFKLPDYIYSDVVAKEDSIVLAVKARINDGSRWKEETKYQKIPKDHLFPPRGY